MGPNNTVYICTQIMDHHASVADVWRRSVRGLIVNFRSNGRVHPPRIFAFQMKPFDERWME